MQHTNKTYKAMIKKDIFYEGKIYIGADREKPYMPEWHMAKHGVKELTKYIEYLQSLTSYLVISGHNFKDFENVTGRYELGYQSWYTTEYRLCNKERYDNSSLDMRRIVALPSNKVPSPLKYRGG